MNETALRDEVIAACRILDGRGLVEGFGHVSARIPGTDRILITPKWGLGLVEADQLVTLDLLSGEALEGGDRAPLEVPMHLGVYRMRDDVGAICRTHSPFACIWGLYEPDLRPVHGFGLMVGESVPVYARDIDLITTGEQGRAVAGALGGAAALLLRGNGCLAVGAGLREATVRAMFLEEAARFAYAGKVMGRDPSGLTAGEAEARRRWFPGELERAWLYYYRKHA